MNATPRAFELQRLSRLLRANARVLVAVFVLALFCGAALARLSLPNEVHARGTARIVRDVVADRADIHVVDLGAWARGLPDGEFGEARADGVHFAWAGAAELGAWFAPQVTEVARGDTSAVAP